MFSTREIGFLAGMAGFAALSVFLLAILACKGNNKVNFYLTEARLNIDCILLEREVHALCNKIPNIKTRVIKSKLFITEKEPPIADNEEQYCPDLVVREFIVRVLCRYLSCQSCSLAHAASFTCMPAYSRFIVSYLYPGNHDNLLETRLSLRLPWQLAQTRLSVPLPWKLSNKLDFPSRFQVYGRICSSESP